VHLDPIEDGRRMEDDNLRARRGGGDDGAYHDHAAQLSQTNFERSHKIYMRPDLPSP
jgi:hypothetical protein